MPHEKFKPIIARAPTRIDLAGGTIDLWPIHCLLPQAATVNVGVSLDASTTVVPSPDGAYRLSSDDQVTEVRGTFQEVTTATDLPLLSQICGAMWAPSLPPFHMTTTAKSPAGAGLGGSSCLGITVAAALNHLRHRVDGTAIRSEVELVRTVQDIEARLIHAPTGCQDYWGGVRGRINCLFFPPGRIDVVTRPAATLPGLDQHVTLCFSGKSRASAINNWEIFKRTFDRDAKVLEAFAAIGAAAVTCAKAVMAGDLAGTLDASRKEWNIRKSLWPNIVSPETEAINDAAAKAGATFTRVCGAGGGGVMVLVAPPERRSAVAAAAQSAGGRILDAHVTEYGLTVE